MLEEKHMVEMSLVVVLTPQWYHPSLLLILLRPPPLFCVGDGASMDKTGL